VWPGSPATLPRRRPSRQSSPQPAIAAAAGVMPSPPSGQAGLPALDRYLGATGRPSRATHPQPLLPSPARYTASVAPTDITSAITDDASPFALPSTRNHPRAAVHLRCLSAVGRALDDGAGSMHGLPYRPLPEICQKLRYTQPRAAPRPNRRQRLSPARSCGQVRPRRAFRTAAHRW
jgi:hypothetical protein